MSHIGYTMTTSSRITARVSEETQTLLKRAAALSGISSINSFVLSSAIEKATQIIRHEEALNLSKHDTSLFLDALEKPTVVNNRLSKAHASYENKIL